MWKYFSRPIFSIRDERSEMDVQRSAKISLITVTNFLAVNARIIFTWLYEPGRLDKVLSHMLVY